MRLHWLVYCTANRHSWKIADSYIHMILGPSVFTFLSYCLSVHALYATVLITQTCQSMAQTYFIIGSYFSSEIMKIQFSWNYSFNNSFVRSLWVHVDQTMCNNLWSNIQLSTLKSKLYFYVGLSFCFSFSFK